VSAEADARTGQGQTPIYQPSLAALATAFLDTTHALRLVFAGVFERYAGARIILGHMGEAIPFQLWRIDSRWEICNRGARSLLQPPSHYIRQNILVTTSGVCSAEPLQCALAALGADHVMFSVDYPFERTDVAASFMDTVPLDEEVRIKVAHANAERAFGLKRA
jgi:2,3-dihydroxybenzoate decarboxylase